MIKKYLVLMWLFTNRNDTRSQCYPLFRDAGYVNATTTSVNRPRLFVHEVTSELYQVQANTDAQSAHCCVLLTESRFGSTVFQLHSSLWRVFPSALSLISSLRIIYPVFLFSCALPSVFFRSSLDHCFYQSHTGSCCSSHDFSQPSDPLYPERRIVRL